MRNLAYILILFASLSTADAAQVRKLDKSGSLVSIKGLVIEKWQMNEHLCLRRGKFTVACGQVIRIQPAGIVAQLTLQVLPFINKEDLKVLKVNPSARGLSTLLGIRESVLEKREALEVTSISFGVLSFLGIWPFAHLEMGINNHFAAGFMPNYFNLSIGNSGMTGVGFDVTLSYYFRDLFRGPYATVAGSINVIIPRSNVIPTPRALSWGGMFNVGWKFQIAPNWTLGAAGGAKYMLTQQVGDFSFNGLMLNIVANASYFF